MKRGGKVKRDHVILFMLTQKKALLYWCISHYFLQHLCCTIFNFKITFTRQKIGIFSPNRRGGKWTSPNKLHIERSKEGKENNVLM